MYVMRHDQTHARLIWLKRQDENKTFAIGFRTPPQDDTGVFHILEHSVLNGSGRYPVKEPFVQLLKSSMNTFLNAFTADDKTVFPVASRNEKDFMNLISVYLDGVFDPEIYRNRKIFEQEGWHYELRDENEEPVYKGVVLNEMKGAYASVDETLSDHIFKALYPDTCYQYSSGGDPAHITDLTYEQFLAAHKRFYHPSNAHLYLDGDMDVDKVLAFINDEYLSHYEAADAHSEIPLQKAVPAKTVTYAYECAEEDLSHRTMISFARIISDYTQVKRNTALDVLAQVLTGTNDAPLKMPFLEKGLCEDVSFDIYDFIQQPWCSLTFRNSEKENLDEIRNMTKDIVNRILQEGFNHDELQAAINHLEFIYREKQEPAGIINGEFTLLAELYGGDPSAYLRLGPVYDELRQDVDRNYFEDLLKEVFADPEHTQTVIAVPSHEEGARRLKAESEKIASAHPDKKEIIRDTRELDIWQNTPDRPEDLARLPHLALSDVDPNPQKDIFDQEEIDGMTFLHYPRPASGICYYSFYFNCAGIRREMLPQLAFYASLLADLPTKSHTLRQLQILINRYIGSLNFTTSTFSRLGENDAATPVLAVRFSCLEQNTEEAMKLVREIMRETIFTPDTIRPLLKQSRQAFTEALIGGGSTFAKIRISAAYSAAGVFEEYTHGIHSGQYLRQLDEHFDDEIGDFIELCSLFSENLFITSRCAGSYAGDHGSEVKAFLADFPHGDAHWAKVHYPLMEKENEAIIIPGGVAYAARGCLYPELSGTCRVLSHILTYEYLWNEVRVKGGAYGTSISLGGGSAALATSYRDPDPAHTLKTLDGCAAFMEQMDETCDDYTDYIIGAIAAGNPVLSPSSKIVISDIRFFSDISYADRQTRRKEMLETDGNRLREIAEGLQKAMQDGMICVVTPEEKLKDLESYHLTVRNIL
jgi:Zn-dependent M16 (insulinase) family peptidase